MIKSEINKRWKLLIVFIASLCVSPTHVFPQLKKKKYSIIETKVLRVGSLVYVLSNNEDYLQKDTVELLDVGDMGTGCPTADNTVNGDFSLGDNSVKKYWVEELYYDKLKQDSLIASLNVLVWEFDTEIHYNNLRKAPLADRHYFKLKYNDHILVFKSFTYLDIKSILLISRKRTVIDFMNCYHSIHSVLE